MTDPARFAAVLKWETAQLRPDQLPPEDAVVSYRVSADARSNTLRESGKLDAAIEADEDERSLNQVYRMLADLEQRTGPRTALCLSGGGIRSATFSLGVLQGLARLGRLVEFDYLSTVSGGGYIGSWLSGWIRHEAERIALQQNPTGTAADPTPVQCRQGLQVIQNQLSDYQGTSVAAESPPVGYLREYSNYLTPRLGLLSADTWTLIATYVRNLLLNWLVILPCVALALLVPQLFVLLAPALAQAWLARLALAAGTLLVGLAIAYISVDLPSGNPPHPRSQNAFLWRCLLPLASGAALLIAYWYSTVPRIELSWKVFAGYAVALHLAAAMAGWTWLAAEQHRRARRWGAPPPTVAPALRRPAWQRFRAATEPFLAMAGAGLLAGLLLYVVADVGAAYQRNPDTTPLLMLVELPWFFQEYFVVPACAMTFRGNADWERLVVVAALPLALQAYAAATTLYVGWVSRYRTEHDREWWSREVGWLYIASAAWIVFAGTALYGDWLLATGGHLLAYVGGLSGIITFLLGRSSATQAGRKGDGAPGKASFGALLGMIGLERLAQVAALVFTIFLLALIGELNRLLRLDALPHLFDAAGLATDRCRAWITSGCGFLGLGEPLWTEPVIWPDFEWMLAGIEAALLLALATVASRRININRFSLHAMYRNRLVRAYLGASRGRLRQAHPFTGFDPGDDLAMSRLAPVRPFHVVNMTLNLVQGARLAWQHRKAESFTATPLHCGSASSSSNDGGGLGYRPTVDYARDPDTGDGISLGTAMAISGAAASPNMGYNSSPLVTLVMTLFNARLGWWLGNPANTDPAIWGSDGPRLSARPIFAEAFGMTDDTSPYVYLSDGGHFENLGLYEMVLRRCRKIVVVDGTADPEYAFEDLGNAVRKIRIDLGIDIEFDRPTDFVGDRRCARSVYLATIHYQRRDGCGGDGTLVYLKPAMCGTEPADVLEYHRAHPRFPHETTVDQWFSEPQFESYRMLGLCIATAAAPHL